MGTSAPRLGALERRFGRALRHLGSRQNGILDWVTRSADEAVARLQEVITEMSGPLPEVEAAAGWTTEKQDQMLGILVDWRDQIENAGELLPRHFKAVIRWFMDLEVGHVMTYDPPDPWCDKIVGIDNFISSQTGS